ncbi:AraC-like DNA-binding protein [Pedobacter sp. UYP30]|uniref:AraC family transcriptional regulator n=1 Tax=Pedobacter sp. UYP30 TaxID=1756400 RepID=UPI00339B4879
MVHSVYLPHPALREFVDNITVTTVDFSVEKDISPIYTFVPTHTRFLCFYLEDKVLVKKYGEDFELKSRSMIIGPQTTPVTLNLGSKHKDVVVCLKPSGMYRLLGIPLHTIVDKDYDARLVLGAEVDVVTDRLRNAKTDDLKNQIIQKYLLDKLQFLKPALPFDMAMLELVRNTGNSRIESVAMRACLSLKQFERESLKRIGLSPKTYAKMIRFSYAYKLKELFPNKSWSSITYQCGYFDQMHLIRDFKFFTGSTPGLLTEKEVISSVRFRTLEDVFL